MYLTYVNAKGEAQWARVESSPSECSPVTKPKLAYFGRLGPDAYQSVDEMDLNYVKRGRRWEWVGLEVGDPERAEVEREALGG